MNRGPYNKMYYTWIKKVFSTINRYFYLKDCIRNGMKIGKHLRIMSGVDFGSEPYLIEIGNNVTLSVDVLFSTHDGGAFVLRNLKEMRNKNINTFGAITLGNNVFVGARTVILPNITVGDNIVIAANSIITKDIKSNCVVAGIPAKEIMSIKDYKHKMFKNNKVTNK